ncbi:MAG: hypothetical protein GY723_21600 [bacterium]|nr:hypothetical protein [bacterium]MCP5067778.1 hypothetical protein [bacterium]
MRGHAPLLLALCMLSIISCFREFEGSAVEPDVRTERLCAEADDPDSFTETTFIRCRVEGASFATATPAPRETLVVMAYNIERGFEADAQLNAILNDPDIPTPDVILLSEADRGCRRTGFRNIARDYAEALGFYYVFATEFVELPSDRGFEGPYDPPLCEHGNAIVARYPLGNVRQIRHAAQHDWYTPPGDPDPDEPRLGGRIAVAADMRVGDRLVRLYSMHLESTLGAMAKRDQQAAEVEADSALVFYPVIAGGDLNAYVEVLTLPSGIHDLPVRAFIDQGFSDPHLALPLSDRMTNFDPMPMIIDFVLVRGAAVHSPGVCPASTCGGLSDHLPIWASVELPACNVSLDPDCDSIAEPEDNCPFRWNPEQTDLDGNGIGDGCPFLPF